MLSPHLSPMFLIAMCADTYVWVLILMGGTINPLPMASQDARALEHNWSCLLWGKCT